MKNKQTENAVNIIESNKDFINRIGFDKDMVSLTDLWKEAGSDIQKSPAKWQETEAAKGFISATQRILNVAKNDIIKSKRGKGGGTYAHKQVALEYSQYLSPELGVLVNEVFFQRVEEEKNPDLIADRYVKAYKKRGMDQKWIRERFEGRAVRNEFTSTLAEHGVKNEGFGDCTNAIYIPIIGGTAGKVKAERGLSKSSNLRDHMSAIELAGVRLSELIASETIEKNNLNGNEQCRVASSTASRSIAKAIVEGRKM